MPVSAIEFAELRGSYAKQPLKVHLELLRLLLHTYQQYLGIMKDLNITEEQ